MAGGPLQAADDMVRIITNGLTFGLADKAAAALGEENTAAKTAAARDRAGIAGDLGMMLGYGGGAKAAFKGITALPAIAKAAFSKKGAALAGLGLGGLVEYNGRTAKPAAAAPAPKAAAAKPTARNTKGADAVTDQIMAGLRAVDAQPLSFNDAVSNFATQNNGISLRQMQALSGVAKDTATRTKTPRAQDVAISKLQAYYDGLHEQEIASGVPQAAADAAWAQRYEGLAKMNPMDAYIRGQLGQGEEE